MSVSGELLSSTSVSGVADLFKADITNSDDSKGYTMKDQEIVAHGGSVVIEFGAKEITDRNELNDLFLETIDESGMTIGLMVDFSLYKTTWDPDGNVVRNNFV